MWTVILEDENNNAIKIVSDEFSIKNLNSINIKTNFNLIKYLDKYGDTKFNKLQMSDLIEDLEKLQTYEPKNVLIKEIIKLAYLCLENNHIYLCFYGD